MRPWRQRQPQSQAVVGESSNDSAAIQKPGIGLQMLAKKSILKFNWKIVIKKSLVPGEGLEEVEKHRL